MNNLRQALLEKLQDVAASPQATGDVPTNILQWFERLKLLQGVPFQYLVPHEKMLPQESIRFFILDQNWIDALVDGAFSIGRSTTGDVAMDRALAASLQDQAVSNDTPVSGFLLRSEVISHWPGLEIEAYADTAQTIPLKRLRLELMSPSVMMGLYWGELASISFHEPPEGVNFGVDMPKDPDKPQAQFHKQLKYLKTSGGHQAGKPMMPDDPQHQAEIPVRPGGKRVLAMNQAAQNIQTKLKGLGYTGKFTSAECALEFVEGMQRVTFNINSQQA